MTKEWLARRVERSEVNEKVPKGHPRFQPFWDELRPDDEIWSYCSPMETWSKMCGRMGYAIVRDGEIVKSCVTLMN